ncbi:TRADD-N-associated membrane domain-containing protein [Catenuloplanes japonicus]|uniref:TRADD-N-associated membrane domain-containing protein n=1 Tax=Catenuloplanes japonicus TaxID=33876 RepID=UPI0012F83797|nr:hypothetical protein [Catenuloplanes japonicus]
MSIPGGGLDTTRKPWWHLKRSTSDDQGLRSADVRDSRGVQVGDHNVQVNVFTGEEGGAEAAYAEARRIFISGLRERDSFITKFLNQALSQAQSTFRMSLVFMTAGGVLVLAAAALTLLRWGAPGTSSVALVSGLGGLIIGTSGAAFWLQADRARKHVESQAGRMHEQLLEERRYAQAIDVLSTIQDPVANDQAKVAMAARLMGTVPTHNAVDDSVTIDAEVSDGPQSTGRAHRFKRRGR